MQLSLVNHTIPIRWMCTTNQLKMSLQCTTFPTKYVHGQGNLFYSSCNYLSVVSSPYCTQTYNWYPRVHPTQGKQNKRLPESLQYPFKVGYINVNQNQAVSLCPNKAPVVHCHTVLNCQYSFNNIIGLRSILNRDDQLKV